MRRQIVIPTLALDRSLLQPLQQQISFQIAAAVRKGALREGARLPSSRLLARLLLVSRSTVMQAYEELIAEGLLQAKPGSGIQVTGLIKRAAPSLPHLRRSVRAAHYPMRTVHFGDPDATALYLNVRSSPSVRRVP